MKEEKKIIDSVDPVKIEDILKILNQLINCICKIKIKGVYGTGFFCKIPFKNETIKVFMTNYHVLNKEVLKNIKKLNLLLNDEKEVIIIDLRINRKFFFNKEYDITLMELKEEDKIKDYLELDDNLFNNNSEIIYEDKSIYILQYPNGKNACVSYGVLNNISEYNIMHKCCTDNGSSGSPILNLETNKVIGIHTKGTSFNYNMGILLKFPLSFFVNKKVNKQVKKRSTIIKNKKNKHIQELDKSGFKDLKIISKKKTIKNNITENSNYNNTYTNNYNLFEKAKGSINEFSKNNFSKEVKTKNTSFSNINDSYQTNYLLTAYENTNPLNKAFLSPKREPGLKLLFLKKSKSKLEELKKNLCKSDSKKRRTISKKKVNRVKVKNLKLNFDEEQNKNKQDLPRHTYNSPKINLTNVPNDKIMDQHNIKKNFSVNNINNSNIQYNSNIKRIPYKKKMINSNTNNIKVKKIENIDCNTLEEAHFLLVKTIQNSKKMMINIDKK